MSDDVVHVARDAHALLLGDSLLFGAFLFATVLARPHGCAHERAESPRQEQRECGSDEKDDRRDNQWG